MLTERAPHRPTPPPPQDLAKGAVTQFKELGDRAEDNKAMWAEAFPKHYAMLEKLVVAGGDAFTSTGVSVGEIYLWSILHQALE